MEIDSNLLKEFAKMTNDSEVKSETKYLRGTIVSNSGGKYVQLDGSSTVTPISEIVNVEEGDRVLVTIENHKATIVGNFTFPPSARKEQEAIDKADSAQDSANNANVTANTAQQKAQEASTKADEAINQSSIASASADEAKEQASSAIAKADSASTNANEAKDLANQASSDATEAKNQAAASQAASANAQAEVTKLQNEVDGAKEDIDKALADLEAQGEEITIIKETYSTKVETENTKAELETTITAKVGELETKVSETYSTKTENVELEGKLQTQITQNAEGLTSQATKIEKLEADTTEAQKDVDEALAQAAAAQSTASEAQTKADAAKAAADAATADAQDAADKATLAQNAADAATAAANAADQAVQEAQGDLNEAKQNLASVTSRVDATEAEIAEAQAKVDVAQEEVNEALADAAEARLAADNAQTAADKAQQDAETAQGLANTAQQKADNAQTAADNAQAAADQAQADVAALTSRVTTAETKITQNSEAIRLSASKTEEIGVKIDNLQVGGRNLLKDTSNPIIADGTDEEDAYSQYRYNHYVLTKSLEENQQYTVSSDIEIMEGAATDIHVKFYDRATGIECGGVSLPIVDNHIEGIITPNSNYASAYKALFYAGVSGATSGNKIKFTNTKLEKGNKATDWTPAPEDVDSAVSNAQTTADNAQADIDNLEVGGRNYALKTATSVTITGTNETNQCPTIYILSQNWTSFVNKKITISFDYEFSEGSSRTNGDSGNIGGIGMSNSPWNRWAAIPVPATAMSGHVSATATMPSTISSTFTIGSRFDYFEGSVTISNFKFEIGNKETDWTPAPEDIENKLVNNYYTKTETDSRITVQADRITSTVSRVETVEKNVDELEVGGRNYIYRGRGTTLDGYFENFDSIEEDDYAKVTITATKSSSSSAYKSVYLSPGFLLGPRDYEVGKQVVYSYDIMFTQWDFDEGAKLQEWWMGQRYSNDSTGAVTEGAWRGVTNHALPKVGTDCELNEWIHVSKVFTIPEPAADGIGTQQIIQLANSGTTDTTIAIALCIKNVKIEYGNRETDWTPSPEEVSKDVSDAQTVAGNAETIATNAQSSVSYAHSLIQQLSDMIANLVTDENGTSLMTQTSDGWRFDMSSINSNLSTLQDEMDRLDGEQGDTNDALGKLQDLVDDIKDKTAYITMSTDDNGDPCIELGKADNPFKVRITNTAIDFLEGSTKVAYVNNNTFYTEKMIVKNELQIGAGPGFVWRTRANGNMGLVYISG